MRAARVAELATGRSRHGAIIVKGGSVLGFGVNRSRTHNTWISGRDRSLCSVHAELSAMRDCSSCSGSTLYVVRINRRGMLRESAPCHNCQVSLRDAGIKRVVHS